MGPIAALLAVVFVTAGVQSGDGATNNCCGVVINGARDTANNFTSDGITVNDVVGGRQTANGFPGGDVESYQELKIMTANNSAEYPQVAQLSMIGKSGSNDLHGSFYWGNFNSKFNARAWNDPTKPSFENHNMFAVNNGGPVYIPGLYDGHDKTFYFFHYSGARYRTGNRARTSVPTSAFRQGDFSALLGKITIVDPLTGVTIATLATPGSVPAAAFPGGSHLRRTLRRVGGDDVTRNERFP